MLRNLKEIYGAQRDGERLLAVQDRLVVLLPRVWEERRDRGLLYAAQGEPARAVADLEAYLAHAPGSEDAAEVAERLRALRRIVGQ